MATRRWRYRLGRIGVKLPIAIRTVPARSRNYSGFGRKGKWLSKVDLKVTSITQPQSSCPFKSARQKIFGLGYHLLVFVYEKKDDPATSTATLNMLHTIFVETHRTADFTMTRLLREHLEAGCNAEDLIGFMRDKNLPIDSIEAKKIAEELLIKPCEQGYLTISNALQWRLQYGRVIEQAGSIDGINRLK